jgi:hypothetical protein
MGRNFIWAGDVKVDLFIAEGRFIDVVGHVFGQELCRRTARIHVLENKMDNQQPFPADTGGSRHLELPDDPNVILEKLSEGSRVGLSVNSWWARKSIKTLPILRMAKKKEERLGTHIVR